MRIFISMLACLVFISLLFPVYALSQDSASRYNTMLESLTERIKSKDQSLGDEKVAARAFKELRFAYTETPQYNPYGGIKVKIGEAMVAAVNNKEYGKALEYAERILKENFVDIEAHMVASLAYTSTGNREKADYHTASAGMLLQSLLDDAGGDTLETAIEVISTDEEYAFLHLSGLQMKSQAELNANGHDYDKLTVVDPVSGKTFDLYFCIDKPYAWLLNSFRKANGL